MQLPRKSSLNKSLFSIYRRSRKTIKVENRTVRYGLNLDVTKLQIKYSFAEIDKNVIKLFHGSMSAVVLYCSSLRLYLSRIVVFS